MRNIRVAALVAAAVGLGVFAVGCGPVPSTGGLKVDTSKLDTSKVAAATGKVTEAADKAKELGDKLQGAADDVKKELTPLQAAFEKMKAKLTDDEKAAGADAVKLKALEPLKGAKDGVEGLMKQITEKVTGLAGLKDIASIDGAVKVIKELIEKVKPMLKDFLPAAK